MLSRFSDDPIARSLLAEASEILGEDVSGRFAADRDDLFDSNRGIQVGVFLANELHRRRLADRGVRAVASLGMSLGEYNHLVDIGAIRFDDALRLVEARGRVYDAGPEGMMVSLFPTTREAVAALLAEVERAGPGRAAISNENSPNQFVIAGETAAVERAAALFAAREFAEPVTIERRIPMHSPVFAPVAEVLRPHLAAAAWRRPVTPYMPNVTAVPLPDPSPETVVDMLAAHVHRPVLWRQSIDAILERHPDAVFVEVGPRRVLCNLLGRKWVRNLRHAAEEADLGMLAAVLADAEAVEG